MGALLVAATLLLPSSAAAQAGSAVLGRITEAGGDVAVENAIVTIDGVGSTLTTPEGTFRFRGVPDGDHQVRVEAFGYSDLTVAMSLSADTMLTLEMEPAPVEVDGILVEAGTLDYEGRVRDPERDFTVVDAQVIAQGRDPVWTDTHGRFDLEDVPEGVPLSFSIRAFGYMPIDTTLVPDDEKRYEFHLTRDAFAEAMIGMQIRRLEERAGGRVMAGQGVLDREEVLRYAGAHTAATMLEFRYPERIGRRIACVVIDDNQVDVSATMGREISDFVLGHTLPEEIERVELLVWDALEGRPIMLRIYTRSFIMAMSRGDVTLREPTMTPSGQCL